MPRTRSMVARLLLCLLVTTSCTTKVVIPPAGYIDAPEDTRGTFTLKTVSGDHWRTRRLTLADSAFVIRSVYGNGHSWSMTPVTVPFAQVASLEKDYSHPGATVFTIVMVLGILQAIGWSNY